jgi:NAD dependent epimerase/dehydratase family enzyme
MFRDDRCGGPYNACAPEAVRKVDLTRALAHALHRPAVLSAPAWALRLVLGGMSVLLLAG